MNHLPCPERTPSLLGEGKVYILKKKKKKNPTRIPNYTHKLTDYKFLQDFIVFFFFWWDWDLNSGLQSRGSTA
jgi:hypothetical protein